MSSDKYRRLVWQRGIKPVTARRGTEHGRGLGRHEWVVERTISRQRRDTQLGGTIGTVGRVGRNLATSSWYGQAPAPVGG
jgi:hypothetical protein